MIGSLKISIQWAAISCQAEGRKRGLHWDDPGVESCKSIFFGVDLVGVCTLFNACHVHAEG